LSRTTVFSRHRDAQVDVAGHREYDRFFFSALTSLQWQSMHRPPGNGLRHPPVRCPSQWQHPNMAERKPGARWGMGAARNRISRVRGLVSREARLVEGEAQKSSPDVSVPRASRKAPAESLRYLHPRAGSGMLTEIMPRTRLAAPPPHPPRIRRHHAMAKGAWTAQFTMHSRVVPEPL